MSVWQSGAHDIIDLRSDTSSKPTAAMRAAMSEAEVGNDGYGEDPTVNGLEAKAAALLAKESAVFMASGTMADLTTALAYCERGDQIVVGDLAHIYRDEMGGVSALGAIHVRPVRNDDRGMIAPDDVIEAMSRSSRHQPRTRLVCLENSHNRCGGTVLLPMDIQSIAAVAHANDAALHIDGARIFNAAVALNTHVAELTRAADTVSFSLSKGLACPVGSLVCGPSSVVERIRRFRRMVGGGMRQSGVIAAAGAVALDTMVDRLREDHVNAQRLADGLATLSGIIVHPVSIRTNIVLFEVASMPAQQFVDQLQHAGIWSLYRGGRAVRMVTHLDVSRADIDTALDRVDMILRAAA